jgi:cytoskeletal protein RodZ
VPFGSLDPFDEETEPIEWYRRPLVLLAWGISVLILIALIVYGIIELVEDQGTTSTPSSTTTTRTTSTTTPTTTTTTTSPPTTTTTSTTTTTPTTSAAPPPAEQPTYTQQQPTHRRHWPSWLPTAVPGL